MPQPVLAAGVFILPNGTIIVELAIFLVVFGVLKAYVVPRNDANAEEIMAFVAERVAPYKKIRLLEFTEQIPRSASGKSKISQPPPTSVCGRRSLSRKNARMASGSEE